MPYTAEINRRRPALLLLMIDQSYSMLEPWAGTGATKAEALAEAVNLTLNNAVALCSKGSARIYDYFEVGVLGYGLDVRPYLHGTSDTQPIIPISELAAAPKRVDTKTVETTDHSGNLTESRRPFPVWVDPSGDGRTPMTQAFRAAHPIVSAWCGAHRESFPPLIVNITDGESTDGDPSAAADALAETGTADGRSLIFNVHLSGAEQQSFEFPHNTGGLPDANAHMLYSISSQLPPAIFTAARASGHTLEPGARGFLYNASAATVFEFLDLGTRAVTPSGLKELTAAVPALGR